ncbi:MAG: Hsp20/alpha crystallin family protein [Ruminococcus sp.]|nr:Hsp20/alpha crystallin family protein [Ruminococcus sp.]
MFGLTPFERRYDPFDIFDDDFFAPAPPMGRHGAPARPGMMRTDIKDEGDKYVMEAELPGFNKEDISLDITDNMLTLSAEHKSETEDKKDNYVRRERHFGSYKRSFDLSGIDTEGITAEYRNGVLTVGLPKKVEKKPESRKLEITGE